MSETEYDNGGRRSDPMRHSSARFQGTREGSGQRTRSGRSSADGQVHRHTVTQGTQRSSSRSSARSSDRSGERSTRQPSKRPSQGGSTQRGSSSSQGTARRSSQGSSRRTAQGSGQRSSQGTTRRTSQGTTRRPSQGTARRSAQPTSRSKRQAREPRSRGEGFQLPGFLQNLDPRFLLMVVAALVIIIALVFGISSLVSRCSGPAADQAQQDQSEQEAEPENQMPEFVGMEGVEYPDPESLAWRDTDFAVDPDRETDWNFTKSSTDKIMYLTFDDGPSKNTLEILDILDKYNAKATFFVIGQDPDNFPLIAEAYHRGHTIGLHSYSHEYSEIYQSEEAFFKDLDKIGQIVKDQIGYVPCFIRFPGGSSNTISRNYADGIMTKLTEEVVDRGYQYYDWNLDSGDGANASTEEMIANVNGETSEDDDPTTYNLLCHDAGAKTDTVAALPSFLEYYQSLGYEFRALDRDAWVSHHQVNN